MKIIPPDYGPPWWKKALIFLALLLLGLYLAYWAAHTPDKPGPPRPTPARTGSR